MEHRWNIDWFHLDIGNPLNVDHSLKKFFIDEEFNTIFNFRAKNIISIDLCMG